MIQSYLLRAVRENALLGRVADGYPCFLDQDDKLENGLEVWLVEARKDSPAVEDQLRVDVQLVSARCLVDVKIQTFSGL